MIEVNDKPEWAEELAAHAGHGVRLRTRPEGTDRVVAVLACGDCDEDLLACSKALPPLPAGCPSYPADAWMFRELTLDEVRQFESYARNHDPDQCRRWQAFHPVCRRVWWERGLRPGAEG